MKLLPHYYQVGVDILAPRLAPVDIPVWDEGEVREWGNGALLLLGMEWRVKLPAKPLLILPWLDALFLLPM